jgi:hypothetical protein
MKKIILGYQLIMVQSGLTRAISHQPKIAYMDHLYIFGNTPLIQKNYLA